MDPYTVGSQQNSRVPKPKKPDAPIKSCGGWSIPPSPSISFCLFTPTCFRLSKLGGESDAGKESGVSGAGFSMAPEELSMVSKAGNLDLNMLHQSV